MSRCDSRRSGTTRFDYARTISIPVLMLHGRDDPRATLDQARRVLGALGGRKELVQFPGVKHQSLYRAAPNAWGAAVAAFLGPVAGR